MIRFEPEILFEDKQIIVINKPAGLMVEKDRFGNPSAIEWVEEYLRRNQKGEIFVANVHRLDRPTSGIVVFAKKKSSLKDLNMQFQERAVEKIYYAITDHVPSSKEGRLNHWLLKDPMQKKAFITEIEKKGSDPVALIYKVVNESGGMYLWEIQLLTGKYHQIRVQLSYISCPIIGDVKYGSLNKYEDDKICLHAGKITLSHPLEKTKMEFIASLPASGPWKNFANLNK